MRIRGTSGISLYWLVRQDFPGQRFYALRQQCALAQEWLRWEFPEA